MTRTSTAVVAAALVAGAVGVATTTLGGPSSSGPVIAADDGTLPAVLDAPDGSVLAAGLVTASSCDEFGQAMEELVARDLRDRGVGPELFDVAVQDDAAETESAATAEPSGGLDADVGLDGATGGDGDGTNVQVAGVDEPDVVEQVGDLTVVGTQGMLRVVTLDGDGAPVARGELLVGAWSELEMLAVGRDRVVGIVRDATPVAVRGLEPDGSRSAILPAWSTTSVVLLDLSDPDAPRELSRVDLEGSMVDARMVDGVARVAVRSDGPQVDESVLPQFDEGDQIDWETAGEEEIAAFEQRWQREYEQSVAEARRLVEPADWQPHARLTDADGTTTVEPIVDCDRIAFPTSYAGTGLLTLAAIDATGDRLVVDDATAVVTAGEQLYSTTDRVVIATTRWERWEGGVPQEEEPEPSVEPFFDDEDAAASAVAGVAALVDVAVPVEPGLWWGRGNTTDLHVFDVDGTVVSHVASGSVDGWLLNQFSMSIHDGVLRVATTGVDEQDGRTASAVTTFRVEGADLVKLGSVGELGPDEEIQSVRFMGDVGYVVTFRRTDPLYVVDLADPGAPRALGELKIEGYSAYLHPLRPGLLLGVGQDADPATGRTRGVQVSTFDVSDPRRPLRLDVDVVPESHTEVEWDHHALTVTDDGVVLVPFEQWSAQDTPGGSDPRLGVLAYDVAQDGTLRSIGVLDAGTRWELRPRRTVALDEVLLTVGEQGVTSWDATSFQPLGSIVFDEPDWDEIERRFDPQR